MVEFAEQDINVKELENFEKTGARAEGSEAQNQQNAWHAILILML